MMTTVVIVVLSRATAAVSSATSVHVHWLGERWEVRILFFQFRLEVPILHSGALIDVLQYAVAPTWYLRLANLFFVLERYLPFRKGFYSWDAKFSN